MSMQLPTSVPIPQGGLLEALGKGLGGGFQQGVQQAGPLMMKLAMAKQAEGVKQQELIQKETGQIEGRLSKRMYSSPKGKSVTHSEIFKYSDLAKTLVEKGASPQEAQNLAYREWALGEEEEEKAIKDEPGIVKRSIETIRNLPVMKQMRDFEKTMEDKRKGLKGGSFSEKIVEYLPEKLRDRTKRNFRNTATAILAGQGLTLDQIEKMEQEDPNFLMKAYDMMIQFGTDIPLMGAMAVPGAVAGGEAGAAVGGAVGAPFGGVGAVPGAGIGAGIGAAAGGAATALGGRAAIMSTHRQWLEHQKQGGPLTFEEFMGRTEKVAKDVNKSMLIGGLTGIGGAGGVPGEIAGMALGESLAEGKPPSPEEMALNTIMVGAMRGAHAVKGKLLPKGYKGLEKIQKEVKSAAKATGKPEAKIAEEVIKKNPDLRAESVYQGDAKDINKVLRSIREIKVEKADVKEGVVAKKEVGEIAQKTRRPLSPEELTIAEKERKANVKRIAKSPLEEYYAPEKEVKHRPETIAKEESRIKEIEKRIEPVHSELKEINKKILDRESQLRRATGKTKEGLKVRLDELKRGRDLIHEQVRDIEFERKYKKKPPTTMEVADQIEKSFKDLSEVIKEPNLEKIKKFEKQFEKDKKYIDQAEKLLKAGELPVKGERDFFIKLKEMYRDAYKDLIDENKDFIEKNAKKRLKKTQKAVNDAKQMNDVIENRLKRAEADLVRQKDKRAIQKMLRGTQGSFYRHQLKRLRGDVEAFQKDLFKRHRLKSAEEIKTVKSTKESFENLKKYSLNPTKENISKAADNIGIPKEKLSSFTEDIRRQASEGNAETLKEAVNKMGERIEEVAGEKKARDELKKAKTKEAKEKANTKLKEAVKQKSKILKFLIGSVIGVGRQMGITIPRALTKYLYPGAAAVAYATGGLLASLKFVLKRKEAIEHQRLIREGRTSELKRFRAKRTPKQMASIRRRDPTYIPGFLQ